VLNEPVNLGIVNGVFIERNQLNDYAFRGVELMDKTFVEFCLDTYDTKLTTKQIASEAKLSTNQTSSSRSPNVRSRYRSGHPACSSNIRVAFNAGHRYMPSFIGASFASATIPAERSLYLASMMLLFRRWDSWRDVMLWSLDWEQSFHEFMHSTTITTHHYIHNTQLERECRAAADAKFDRQRDGENYLDDERDNASLHASPDDDDALSQDIPLYPVPFQYPRRVCEYAEGAMQAGMHSGLLPDPTVLSPLIPAALVDPVLDSSDLGNWLSCMDDLEKVDLSQVLDDSQNLDSFRSGDVLPGYDPDSDTSPIASPDGLVAADQTRPSKKYPDAGLNTQQQLAFDIVKQHLSLVLQGKDPSQLLMKVMGPPGTGKSWVIEAVTMLFMSLVARSMLEKTAHQGSVAALMGGSTMCSILGLVVKDRHRSISDSTRCDKLSAKQVSILVVRFQHVQYLIIDEISQASFSFLFAV
jgi:hypothetical protein